MWMVCRFLIYHAEKHPITTERVKTLLAEER